MSPAVFAIFEFNIRIYFDPAMSVAVGFIRVRTVSVSELEREQIS